MKINECLNDFSVIYVVIVEKHLIVSFMLSECTQSPFHFRLPKWSQASDTCGQKSILLFLPGTLSGCGTSG